MIDALRADRIGAYGYEAAITPTLDSLATAGLRFEDAMTTVPVTLPAVGTILTGRTPLGHGLRDNGFFVLEPETRTLAHQLSDAGYRPAAVVASAVLAKDRGLGSGFEVWDDEFAPPYPIYDPRLQRSADDFARTRRRADRVTDRALSHLEERQDDPWFLLVHYFDVHMEHDPPPRFAAQHPGRPYDAELTFVDAELRRLLDAVGDDVLVIVVADHGESQGEHGEPQHGFLLYQGTLRVPFLVAGPGVPVGVRAEPVSLIDVTPSVLAACGLPADPDADGIALDWAAPAPDDRPLYAEALRPLLSYGWAELRALRQGPWKLIRGGGTEELYRLDRDPGETTDRPDAEVRRRLGDLLEDVVAEDDAEAVLRGLDEAENPQPEELLASLGYLSGHPDPGAEDRPHPREALPDWTAFQVAKVRLREAALLAARGDVAAAESIHAGVTRQRPDMKEAIAFGGYLAELRGDAVRAEQAYREALGAGSEEGAAVAGLTRLLRARAREALGADDPSGAIAVLEELKGLTPADPVTRYNLAIALDRAGRVDAAKSELEEFLLLAPDDPDANAAREYLRAGRWP